MEKKKVLIIITTLIILITLLLIFVNKSTKDEEKTKNEYDYSYRFDYYIEQTRTQYMIFNYKKKRLSSIVHTLVYSNPKVAKKVYKEYKASGEYEKVELKDNLVKLTYNKDNKSYYMNLTKDELIDIQKSAGFEFTDSDK